MEPTIWDVLPVASNLQERTNSSIAFMLKEFVAVVAENMKKEAEEGHNFCVVSFRPSLKEKWINEVFVTELMKRGYQVESYSDYSLTIRWGGKNE